MSADSEAYWDEYYRDYAPDRLPWETGKPDKNLIALIEKGVVEKGRVLDICSGLGTQTIYMAKKGFEVYGIEISSTAVDMAKKRCTAEGVDCNLTVGDATKLNYPDKFFTFIFDRGCFHAISSRKRKKFIEGIHRVLKKHGKYHMMCFSYKDEDGPHQFTEEDIRKYFSDRFKILSIKEDNIKDVYGRKHYFYVSLMEKK